MAVEIDYLSLRSRPAGAPGSATESTCWFSANKPAIDRAAALLLFALTWPIILLLMVLVKLTSRGPALYKQERLGLDGRPYTIFKIRTMRHNCEQTTGPCWATARDSRVTRLGRLLRCCHLDELPQLWNVLCGEMSLVGPRPERPEIVRQLEEVIPGYRERLRVRPGITGLAQVQLPPDEDVTGVRHKVIYDVYYIRHMGLWLDVRILAGTALKMFGLPFEAIRQVLGLPGKEDVEGSARARDAAREQEIPLTLTITGCTTCRT